MMRRGLVPLSLLIAAANAVVGCGSVYAQAIPAEQPGIVGLRYPPFPDTVSRYILGEARLLSSDGLAREVGTAKTKSGEWLFLAVPVEDGAVAQFRIVVADEIPTIHPDQYILTFGCRYKTSPADEVRVIGLVSSSDTNVWIPAHAAWLVDLDRLQIIRLHAEFVTCKLHGLSVR